MSFPGRPKFESQSEAKKMEKETATQDFVQAEIAKGHLAIIEKIGQIQLETAKAIGSLRTEMAEMRTEMAQMQLEIAKDIGSLRTEMAEMRTEIAKELGDIRTEIAKNLGSIRTEIARMQVETAKSIGQLDVKVEQKHNQLVRWIVGTVLAVAGLLFTAIKFFG